MQLIEKIESEQIKKHIPFRVGDSVKVHTRVRKAKRSGCRSSPASSSRTRAAG